MTMETTVCSDGKWGWSDMFCMLSVQLGPCEVAGKSQESSWGLWGSRQGTLTWLDLQPDWGVGEEPKHRRHPVKQGRNSTSTCHLFQILPVAVQDGNFPGVHPAERGPGWCALQLERVALQPPGGHPDGRPRGCSLHAAEGAARSAPHSVWAGAVQPRHLPGRAQSFVVSTRPSAQIIPGVWCCWRAEYGMVPCLVWSYIWVVLLVQINPVILQIIGCLNLMVLIFPTCLCSSGSWWAWYICKE